MSDEQMRKAYEKYFHLPWGESDSDQEAWEACWTASREALVIQVPELQLCCEDFGVEFIKNIEAAGVKVKP